MHFACTCSVASWKDPLEGRFIVYMYAFSRWHWLRSDFLTTFRISRYQNTYTRTNRMSFKISGTNKKKCKSVAYMQGKQSTAVGARWYGVMECAYHWGASAHVSHRLHTFSEDPCRGGFVGQMEQNLCARERSCVTDVFVRISSGCCVIVFPRCFLLVFGVFLTTAVHFSSSCWWWIAQVPSNCRIVSGVFDGRCDEAKKKAWDFFFAFFHSWEIFLISRDQRILRVLWRVDTRKHAHRRSLRRRRHHRKHLPESRGACCDEFFWIEI